jgi:MFS family permease
MSPEQIAEERRRGRLAGLAAIAAAVAFGVGGLWYQSINSDAPERNGPALLRFFDKHPGELIAASVLQAIGMLLVIAVTVHLYRATRARRPDEPTVVLVMGVYGPIAFALSTVLRGVVLSVSASDFAAREFQTIDAADDVFKSPLLIASTVLGFSGVLALAFWLVKGCLDAMRVGLLGRFMGVVGVALGPALVLGFGSILLPVWLVALAALFFGLWPRGLPPAWQTGQAIPWPSARESLEGGIEDGLVTGPNGEVEAVGPGVRPSEPSDGAATGGRRKRKRRR